MKSEEQRDPYKDYRDIQGTIFEPSTVIKPENLLLDESSRIDSFTTINCSGGVEIEEESVIHPGSRVIGSGGMTMGARSVVTYNCVLVSAYPDPIGPMSSMVPKEQVKQHKGRITLKDEVFIGSNAVIMPDVVLHEGAVVGANCYIDEDVPPYSIVYPNGEIRERHVDPDRFVG